VKKTFYTAFILILISGLVFSQAVLKKQTRPVLKLKPKITVKYPNGGEIWKRGETRIIRWSSTGVKGKVRVSIKATKTGKSLFATTVNATTNSVKYKVPNTLKGIRKVRVHVFRILGTGPLGDSSNADFTLLGKIKIIAVSLKTIKITIPPKKTPPEYITFTRNGRYAVMWKTTGKINAVGIKLVWRYKNEPPLVYVLTPRTPNDGRHDIVITSNIPAIKYYKLIVFDADNPKIKHSRTVNIKL